MWHLPVREKELPEITVLAERLNARIAAAGQTDRPGSKFARLPDLRRQFVPRARKSPPAAFNIPRSKPRAWTFHSGGSKELQFNVGYVFIDGEIKVRHGLCFNLKTATGLLDPVGEVGSLFIPHFNDYVNRHPQEVADLCMWSERSNWGSTPRPAGPILAEEVGPKTFIFMGNLAPAEPTDDHLDVILALYDRLIPLYVYVMERGLAERGNKG